MSLLTNWLSLSKEHILALVPWPWAIFEAASLIRERSVAADGQFVLSRKCSLTLVFLTSVLQAGVTKTLSPFSSVKLKNSWGFEYLWISSLLKRSTCSWDLWGISGTEDRIFLIFFSGEGNSFWLSISISDCSKNESKVSSDWSPNARHYSLVI